MSVEQATAMATPVAAPITVEQLWEIPETLGSHVELVNGEIVKQHLPTIAHNEVAALLERLLGAFIAERNLGVVCPAHTGHSLSRHPDTLRIPDVSFVSWEHVPAEGVPDRCWSIAPDLAVEVVSSSDLAYDLHNRIGEYFAAGTRLVWVLWPKTRTVSVYAERGVSHELGADETLDGGEVLPGFTVQVAALFNVRRKRAG